MTTPATAGEMPEFRLQRQTAHRHLVQAIGTHGTTPRFTGRVDCRHDHGHQHPMMEITTRSSTSVNPRPRLPLFRRAFQKIVSMAGYPQYWSSKLNPFSFCFTPNEPPGTSVPRVVSELYLAGILSPSLVISTR